MNIKKYFVCTILLIFIGCSSTIKLKPETIPGNKSSEIVSIIHEVPEFSEMTPGKVALMGAGASIGGVLGSIVYSASNGNNAPDTVHPPTHILADEIGQALSQKYALKYSGIIKENFSENDAAKIALEGAPDKLVLSIIPKKWGIMYFPFLMNSPRYKVLYVGTVQLIDSKNSTILFRESCNYDPDKSDTAPTYEELIADNGKLLKLKFEEAAEYCLKEFKQNQLS